MKSLKIENLGNHHAVLINSSSRDELTDHLWGQINLENYPNKIIKNNVIDIEMVRDLISWANTSFNDKKRAVISFHTITIPAQNALLKVLEEPRGEVSFILITSSKESLLPTVVSRLHEIKTQDTKNKTQDDVIKFFSTKPTERIKLKIVTDLLNEEDEMGRKNRESLKNFISSLVLFARENNLESDKLKKLLEMESYASDPSASGKMLIEYLSLLLPVIK